MIFLLCLILTALAIIKYTHDYVETRRINQWIEYAKTNCYAMATAVYNTTTGTKTKIDIPMNSLDWRPVFHAKLKTAAPDDMILFDLRNKNNAGHSWVLVNKSKTQWQVLQSFQGWFKLKYGPLLTKNNVYALVRCIFSEDMPKLVKMLGIRDMCSPPIDNSIDLLSKDEYNKLAVHFLVK